MERMKDLGVVIGATPTFIRQTGDAWRAMLGDKRIERFMVTREWIEAGVHLAIGADAPAMPWHAPQMTMWAAMTRLPFSRKVLGPGQRMTIHEAMHAHTIGAAYAAHEEKIKGSIEPGKMADLAVWTKDPYIQPQQQLHSVTIDLTMVGGKVVYQRAQMPIKSA